MKTAPIVAARVERTPDGIPYAPEFGDLYHPRSGAWEQAQHVFLAGNGLPARWAGRDRFVVLETGFGLGNNFLATWAAWRADAQRCARLHFVSIEARPPTRDDLAALPRAQGVAALAGELVTGWPPLVHNLHRLAFEGGRVQLLLAFGDVAAWLPEFVARVDAIDLDGFAPDRNPQMWQPRLFKAIARLASPGTTAATWSAARAVRDGLSGAGFTVRREPGSGGKRDITVATYAPAPTVRPASPGRPRIRDVEPHALIVGAGLAGCSAAWALAEQGWRSTLIERRTEPAREGSGNPAGLFHGIVNPQDGAHARLHRAAALEAQRAVRHALAHDGVRGGIDGLLRIETERDLAAMHASLAHLGLPLDYVQALDAREASMRAGLALAQPAWFYPGGGWVDPAGLAASYLRRAGPAVQWRGDCAVARLRPHGTRWQLLDANGAVIDEASSVVLANAGDVLRLLEQPDWPIEPLRGQISIADATAWRACGVPLPSLPLVGGGYLLPASDGSVVFGATSDRGDTDASVRTADHARNLEQVTHLLCVPVAINAQSLQGRTAWRWTTGDRLPVIGAVPDTSALATQRADQPRFVARRSGLFVYTGLGSRGITWSALGGQVLAAWVSGAPMPIESSLLDAVDPARFVTRAVRHAAGQQTAKLRRP